MTYDELKKCSAKQNPSIALDLALSRRWRWSLRVILFSILIVSFTISILENMHALAAVEGLWADGISLLSVGLLLFLVHLESFYYSGRFARLSSRLRERFPVEMKGPSYHTALVMAETDEFDVTAGLLNSKLGQKLLLRLDVGQDTINSFLCSDRKKVLSSQLVFDNEYVNFADYASVIYDKDESFRAFLSSHSVNEKHYMGAAKWFARLMNRSEHQLRWWSRDNLESIPSLATTWSYGIPVEIRKYGAPFEYRASLSQIDLSVPERQTELEKLENFLSRDEAANVVIVDDEERSVRRLLARLYKKMRSGHSLSVLEHKQIIEFEWNLLLAEKSAKAELEAELVRIFSENAAVGNIVIYIPHFPQFIKSAEQLGVNIGSILEEFLNSRQLQIVTQSGRMDFHNFIETNPGLVTCFERLVLIEESPEASLEAITEKAQAIERRSNLIFSYQSLIEVADSAYNKIVYGEMPQKALDLLDELAPWAMKENIKIVRKSDVLAYVEQKTGVPSGELDSAETEKLEKLEEVMHQSIVGQQTAIEALSSAMRRIRSGITNSKRPFASFLFLGPTGVGKTETCKALARVFFGSEDRIMRFDMTEYSGPEALPRLIGSANENRSGVLAGKIRDNPYGVLLLDEFEKASPDVHDLFLQILDEGFFTDALDSKVNCRNLIVIATSNAGSPLIWQLVEQNQSLTENKEKIIDAIIAERIFKPELLNRFDGAIVFSPLHNGDLLGVAQKMFEGLAKRLEQDKQIKLVGSPDLLAYLVQEGGSEQFGARSVNRIIQEKVEDFVARKIIAGLAKPGTTLEIHLQDIQKGEPR